MKTTEKDFHFRGAKAHKLFHYLILIMSLVIYSFTFSQFSRMFYRLKQLFRTTRDEEIHICFQMEQIYIIFRNF